MALTPEALARLTKLHLRTRVVVDGLLAGQHRSAHRGRSVEFSRAQGVQPRQARSVTSTTRQHYRAKIPIAYYVKRYEQETNLRAYLVVDASASMANRLMRAGANARRRHSVLRGRPGDGAHPTAGSGGARPVERRPACALASPRLARSPAGPHGATGRSHPDRWNPPRGHGPGAGREDSAPAR